MQHKKYKIDDLFGELNNGICRDVIDFSKVQ